jgi:hypothetical protein
MYMICSSMAERQDPADKKAMQGKHSAAWVFMGALGAATGCGLVLLIQRLIGQR